MIERAKVTSVRSGGVFYFIGQHVNAFNGKEIKKAEIIDLVSTPINRYLATVKFENGNISKGFFLSTLQII